MTRTLVIHPGALGDVLQTVPALRALGPDARVAFCGQPRLAALLAGVGAAGEALSFDSYGLEALFTDEPAPPALAERLSGFHRVVSWFGSRDDRYPERLRSLVPSCVVALPVPEAPEPVWMHLLATLRLLDHPAVRPPLRWTDDRALRAPLAVPARWRQEARRTLDALGVPGAASLLVVHPGAGGRSKRVAPAVLAAAVERAVRQRPISPMASRGELRVLVHQGPADREAVERLAALLEPPAATLLEPSLPLLAGVLSLADVYLGGDSGVSHLAAAVGTPSAIVFPPSTRERWTPWSATARVITPDDARDPVATPVTEALLDMLASRRREAS
jgi:ADP-heptose:LPS heptosyltransferase